MSKHTLITLDQSNWIFRNIPSPRGRMLGVRQRGVIFGVSGDIPGLPGVLTLEAGTICFSDMVAL